MTDKIVNMADLKNDGTLWSPAEMVKDAINDLSPGGERENFNKCVILYLNDQGDKYQIGFTQAGMKMSECIALCEAMKMVFLREMDQI